MSNEATILDHVESFTGSATITHGFVKGIFRVSSTHAYIPESRSSLKDTGACVSNHVFIFSQIMLRVSKRFYYIVGSGSNKCSNMFLLFIPVWEDSHGNICQFGWATKPTWDSLTGLGKKKLHVRFSRSKKSRGQSRKAQCVFFLGTGSLAISKSDALF